MPSEERPKSKRPANTAFKQQRLKAWQPILTPKTVLPAFFLVGAVFIPLGIGLYIASDRVKEVMFDYTKCRSIGNTSTAFQTPPADVGVVSEWKWDEATQTCTVRFVTKEYFPTPVFLYYRLTNFYQNHRRYVKSFDAAQLKGDKIRLGDSKALANCKPLRLALEATPDAKDVVVNGNVAQIKSDAIIYPCGLIANSMFSDEISNLTCVRSDPIFNGVSCDPVTQPVQYQFQEGGIAWPSDKEKFGKTQWAESPNEEIATSIVPPPLWRQTMPKYRDGYNQSNLPNLKTWERFQVWMRTAALPNFRKLYGRNNATPLPPATWEISITDTFDVDKFSGTKSIVISTTSVLGGKNPFLGVAYLTVGVICIVLGLVFLIRHMIKPRKLGDHTYLSWNQPQQNPANRAPGVPEVGGERSSLMGR